MRRINSLAEVYDAEQSNVPLELMLNIKAFSMARALAVEEDERKAAAATGHHAHPHHEGHEHDEHGHCKGHQHDDSVVSVTLESPQAIAMDAFRSWLAKWLWPDDNDKKQAVQVFRVKGYVYIEGHDTKHQLQGVHELFDLQPSGVRWAESEPRGSRIVVIGKRVQAVLDDWQREFGGKKAASQSGGV